MRRAFGEGLMSAGTVAVLLIALVVIDDRVREQISERFMTRPSVELASAGHQIGNLTSVIAQAARRQRETTRNPGDSRGAANGTALAIGGLCDGPSAKR